jgi:hypothetical protein
MAPAPRVAAARAAAVARSARVGASVFRRRAGWAAVLLLVLLADGAEAGHKRTHEEYMDNFHGVLNNGGGVYGRGVCLAPQVRQRILGGSAAGVHGQANATYFGACCHRVTVWRMEGCNGVARTRGPPPSGPLGLWGRWCLRRLVHKSPLLKQREYVDLLWMLYGVNSSRATVCRALAYMGLTWQV